MVEYFLHYFRNFLPSGEDEEKLIPEGISNECVIQCWFRFLHILGNPVELSRPSVIANTPKFLHMAITSEIPIEPEEHECLKNLPNIFYRAMRSVAFVADAFLGQTCSIIYETLVDFVYLLKFICCEWTKGTR